MSDVTAISNLPAIEVWEIELIQQVLVAQQNAQSEATRVVTGVFKRHGVDSNLYNITNDFKHFVLKPAEPKP